MIYVLALSVVKNTNVTAQSINVSDIQNRKQIAYVLNKRKYQVKKGQRTKLQYCITLIKADY